jgi:signal transduction histidine kinase
MDHIDQPPVGLTGSIARPAILRAIDRRQDELVRVMWLLTAALALSIVLISLPAYIVDLTQPVNWPALEHPAKPDLALALLKNVVALTGVLMCFILAFILFRYRRGDRMAVYASFLLLFYSVASAGPVEQLAIYMPSFERTAQSIVFLAGIPWAIFFSLFPHGQIVPRWGRWLTPHAILWAVVLAVFNPFADHLNSPAAPLLELVWTLSLPVVLVYAQGWRYRHASSSTERQQTKWIVFGLFVTLTLFTISTIPWVYVQNRPPGTISTAWVNWISFFLELIWVIMIAVLPISMTIAVLRYRLWDINPIINRTLVYTSLTGLVAAIYILIVGSLSAVLQVHGSLLVSLLATGAVAMLFQPLRDRLQRWVNRWMYGERDNPYVVLTSLGQRLETAVVPAAVLPTLVETIAHALKLPYVAIALKEGEQFSVASEFGLAPRWLREEPDTAEAGEFLTLPLVYQAETIGRLTLAPRSPIDPFIPTERALLADIARQVGVAAHAVRLTAALQRSRERLVTTREEERRRLRRDLHDGLGPALAAISFKLDATTNLIGRDPDAARALVADLKIHIRSLLDDIRRIAYALRPPALDELGLVGALREHIASNQGQGLRITLEAPEDLPVLAAAVEVAAYRITLEAITNVQRHAQARDCHVRLALCDDLCLEISDNGRGLPDDLRVGVGIASMRERAEELGGTCKIESQPGQHTRVLVELPLMINTLKEEGLWKLSES